MRIRSATFGVFLVIGACGGEEPPAKAPAPPPAPKDPPVLVRMAAACARVSACTRAQDAPRFRDPSACVDWWMSVDQASPDPLRSCLDTATTCEQVTTCMHGGGDARAAAFCAKNTGVASGCDGDRLVSCGEDDAHDTTVIDCAAIGGSCRDVKSAGGLVIRSCWSPQKCPSGAPDVRCDGPGAVISCRDGAYERASCRPGTTCEEKRDSAGGYGVGYGDEGDAQASCEVPGRRRCVANHCESDRLVECERGKAKVTDCVGYGLRCAGTGPRAGCYVPANVECDKELLPKCEGGAVVFCAAGRIEKVACASIGLGTCNPSAKGPFAACSLRPPPALAK